LIPFTDPASDLLRDQEIDAREKSSRRVPASISLPFKKRRALRNKAIPMDEEQRRVVYRYLIARVGLRKADLPPLSDLEYQMKHGFDRLTGGVVVNRNATQPITADDKDPAFYAAVVNGHAEAIDITPLDLQQTRNFVLHNKGSLPPPFGRSDADVTGPTDDMPDVGHQLTSRLDPGMAAKTAQWGSYPPDISDAAAG
jgi:hypothetical protein